MPHTIKIKYDSIDVLKFILSFLIIQIHTLLSTKNGRG